jgi:hypothetical protein
MRTYSQLSKSEQLQAIQIILVDIVNLFFTGVKPPIFLAQQINTIFQKAEENNTPWFAGEMMLNDKELRKQLEILAEEEAKNALYPYPREHVPRFIFLEPQD